MLALEAGAMTFMDNFASHHSNLKILCIAPCLYWVFKLLIMMTSSNGNIFALLALCAGNSPVTGEFPSQRPVTQSFDVFFDLRLNKRLSKQSRYRWVRRHRAYYDVNVMDRRLRATNRQAWWQMWTVLTIIYTPVLEWVSQKNGVTTSCISFTMP